MCKLDDLNVIEVEVEVEVKEQKEEEKKVNKLRAIRRIPNCFPD